MQPKMVITAGGVRKIVVAQNSADFNSAVTIAKAEQTPKTPDINDKTFANKRQKDL